MPYRLLDYLNLNLVPSDYTQKMNTIREQAASGCLPLLMLTMQPGTAQLSQN